MPHLVAIDVPEPPALQDEQVRKDLARVVLALFARWNLGTEQQLALLGLSPESRRLLAQYRTGDKPLPGGRDSLDRAGYLMGIHKGLHLLFPEDEELRYGWVHLRNALLDGDAPLQVMLRDGLVGLARVARFVAFQRGQ